jgi:hypothetical protein
MNILGFPVVFGPNMATGNSTAVMATKNNEIPSTPTFQAMPNSLIHGCWLTNWKPAWPFLNSMTKVTTKASSAKVAIRPTGRASCKRD